MKNNKKDLLSAANKKLKRINKEKASFKKVVVLCLIWGAIGMFLFLMLKQKGIL